MLPDYQTSPMNFFKKIFKSKGVDRPIESSDPVAKTFQLSNETSDPAPKTFQLSDQERNDLIERLAKDDNDASSKVMEDLDPLLYVRAKSNQ